MKIKKILMLLLVTACAFAAGCGASGSGTSDAPSDVAVSGDGEAASESGSDASTLAPEKDLTGSYKLKSYVSDGVAATEDELEFLNDMIKMEFYADGTGEFSMSGTDAKMKWSEDHLEIEGADTPFTYENGELTIEDSSGSVMVFEKK